MLSIAIYTTNDISQLRSMIQDFLIESKIMAKVSVFNDTESFLTVLSAYDIYILDMDCEENTIALGKQKMETDVGSHFIYISADCGNAYKATKIRADYFLSVPIEKEEFFDIMKEIRTEIRDDAIIIQLPQGERRIRTNQLNYINIVKRCLCYHLKDGTMFDGQTLRNSFEKAISPLQHHKSKSFLFLPPSLLINVGEIKILNNDNIIFENDDVLYIPKKSYDVVHDAWIDYNKFVNL